jgi:hypothetical protein
MPSEKGIGIREVEVQTSDSKVCLALGKPCEYANDQGQCSNKEIVKFGCFKIDEPQTSEAGLTKSQLEDLYSFLATEREGTIRDLTNCPAFSLQGAICEGKKLALDTITEWLDDKTSEEGD